MSVKALAWAWGSPTKGTAKLVLLALADQANDEGHCWPGRAKLATKCGVSDRTVTEQLAILVRDGLIRSDRRFRIDGSQTSSDIYLLMAIGAPPLAESSSPPSEIFQGALEESSSHESISMNLSVEGSAASRRARSKGKTALVQTWGHHADQEAFILSMLPELADVMSERDVRDETEQCLGYKTTANYPRLDLTAAKWLRKNAQQERDRRARNQNVRPNANRNGQSPGDVPRTPAEQARYDAYKARGFA